MEKLNCSSYTLSTPGLRPSPSGRSLRASPALRSPRGRGCGMPPDRLPEHPAPVRPFHLTSASVQYRVHSPLWAGLMLLFNAGPTRRIGEVIERFWPSRSGEGRLGRFLVSFCLCSPFLHRDFVACYAASERGEVHTAEVPL